MDNMVHGVNCHHHAAKSAGWNPRLINVVLSQKIQGHDSTHHRMRASVFGCVPTAAKLVQSRDAGVTFMAISLPARRTRISVSWPDLSASIAYV